MTITGKLIRFIVNLFKSARKELKALTPVAIQIVTKLKEFMDSPADDMILSIIESAVPGTADDILIERIKTVVKDALPKILARLTMANEIIQIERADDQIKAALGKVKLCDDAVKNAFYHNACFLIIQELSDKVTWSQAVLAAEVGYKNPEALA